ncbi:MAG: hypothetical protein M3H12_14805 [Chromatiales bacterium]|nr:hypothetical protein [Gammaproteobacteria bacterium]
MKKDNVLQFPIRSVDESSKSVEEHQAKRKQTGKIASERLKAPRKKLSWDDRESIATRLHKAIVGSGVKAGILAEKAKFANGTRDLSKTRLPEGNDPKTQQLFAHSNRYYDVIEALANLTGQNIHLLANRITLGTVAHPTRVDDLNEIEKMLRALELRANDVDKELGLFEQYRETMRLKLDAFARGGLEDWPNHPLWEDDIPNALVLADLDLSKRAFWPDGSEDWSAGPTLDSLTYLPHVYLGIIADWQDWGISGDFTAIRAERQELMAGYDKVPRVNDQKEPGLPIMSNMENTSFDYGHSWLILYPDQKMSTVIPVLLTLDPTVGTTIERLTVNKLIELEKVELIGKGLLSAYEGLQRLVGERTTDDSGFALTKAWIETGRNLQKNPFLSEAREIEVSKANRDMTFSEEVSDENE